MLDYDEKIIYVKFFCNSSSYIYRIYISINSYWVVNITEWNFYVFIFGDYILYNILHNIINQDISKKII